MIRHRLGERSRPALDVVGRLSPCLSLFLLVQGSTELCTPAEVASLNLHFKLSRWGEGRRAVTR